MAPISARNLSTKPIYRAYGTLSGTRAQTLPDEAFRYDGTMNRGGPVESEAPLVRLSDRGQVTVPSSVRRRLGLRSGDAFRVRVDDGRLILDPVAVVEIELYDEARIAEFEQASVMTEAELRSAEEAWRRQR